MQTSDPLLVNMNNYQTQFMTFFEDDVLPSLLKPQLILSCRLFLSRTTLLISVQEVAAFSDMHIICTLNSPNLPQHYLLNKDGRDGQFQ
jgi:hypothetical protein